MGFELSTSFLPGLVMILIGQIIVVICSSKAANLKEESLGYREKRIQLMNEILTSISLIKFYTWEENFKRKIEKMRVNEIKFLKRAGIYQAISDFFAANTIVISIFLTVVTYVYRVKTLESSKFFTTFLLYSLCIEQLSYFKKTLKYLSNALISSRRIENFLKETDSVITKFSSNGTPFIKLQNVTFVQSGTNEEKEVISEQNQKKNAFKLENVSLDVKENSLVIVVGSVGSGNAFFF